MIKMYSTKNHASSYIYNKAAQEYDKSLINTLLVANRIDKRSNQFAPIIDEVKRRQISPVLLDVLMRKNVVLLMCNKSLPAAFSVFTAKDVRDEKKEMKVFIDFTPVVSYKDGFYYATNINALIAFLVNAMVNLIYYTEPKRFLSNSNLTLYGTNCFANMFCYILDYLRVSGYAENSEKILYLVSLYYQTSVLLKPLTDSSKNVAMKISQLTPQEAHACDFLYDEEVDFKNIDNFVRKITELFKLKGFGLDVLVEKWLYLFGNGTQFGLELFPSFVSMITNAYTGSYLNQQKQIEKCLGKNLLNNFSFEILKIGKDSIRTF